VAQNSCKTRIQERQGLTIDSSQTGRQSQEGREKCEILVKRGITPKEF